MILEDLTREERLLVNLIKASCAGRQSRALDQFFDDLDITGWLIELARVHVRLSTGVSCQHGEFATVLQLHDGRAYRLMLVQDTPLRAHVLAVARTMLMCTGDNVVTQAQRMKPYQDLQLELGLKAGNRPRGRRIGPSDDAIDPMSRELERLRISAGLKLKEWALRIGTSENTYRKRLIENDVPPEWVSYGGTVCKAEQDRRLELAAAQIPAVGNKELQDAFGVTWTAYTVRTGTAPVVSTVSQEEQWKRDDEELMQFKPSPEEDVEGLEADEGELIEPPLVTPEELEEFKRKLKERSRGSE